MCGPILTSSCAIWCDNTRLSEELIQCHIGSFVQVHIKALCSDLVRIDLQAALQRSIHTMHLPGNTLHDDLVKMKVFVPQGVTCFSGATFDCTSSFENWQTVLMEEGRRVYPGKNPDTMIFHRVHKAIEEVCPVFEPAVKHFILADSEEQEHTRTVVFAIFTSRFEFFGASHCTPVTQVWDILDLCGGERGWIIYHNNQRLRHQKVTVDQEISLPVMSDVTAPPCYWRIARLLILPTGGILPLCQYLVMRQDLPPLCPLSVMLQAVPEMMLPLHSKTRGALYSSLEKRGGRRRRDDRIVSFDVDSFQ